MNSKVKDFIVLQFVMIIFSLTSVFSKISSLQASEYGVFSIQFILSYSCVMVSLFIYAILWQKIIKKVDLSVAYVNKAIVVIWSLVWSVMFFNEKITVNNIIGIVVIILGILMVVRDE